ncbi:MAG: YigZ family protein [Bacilli bacterium]|nr:YigZ family protein [Bacilli bacterium]
MGETKRSLYIIKEGKGVYKELGSEFVAIAFPLSSAEEFKSRQEAFMKECPKADHYPYAYRIKGSGRSSDDGEPGSSAGRPMLSLLEDKGIDDAGILVARYFGGSKLGIPRLRKAFLSSSSEALNNARLAERLERFTYELEVDYSTYERLRGLSERGEFMLVVTDFGINVNIRINSSDKIDGLLEKRGLLLPLPEPEITSILEELE